MDFFVIFSVQFYWQVLGQARFFSNFDQSFVDDLWVFVVGSGDVLQVDSSQMMVFVDPLMGFQYGALKIDGWVGFGQAVLDRVNKMRSWSNYCDENNSMEPIADDCDFNINAGTKNYVMVQFLSYIEMVKVMADLLLMMSYGNPYFL